MTDSTAVFAKTPRDFAPEPMFGTVSPGPIYVVDDDTDLREVLTEFIAAAGYQVSAFASGQEALAASAEFPPGLVLLDINLKGENGMEIAMALRQTPQGRDVPMISMSGCYQGREHTLLLSLCGVQRCLVKPFNPHDLLRIIATALRPAPASIQEDCI